MRRFLLGGLIVSAFLSGCGGLLREPRPTVWLGLEPPLPEGGLRAGGPTLEVSAFATSPPFATDRVASREGTSRWNFANYHHWTAEPGELVAVSAREYLSRSDVFAAVFTTPGSLDADYRVGGAVRALYWDRSRQMAVLECEASLTKGVDHFLGFWVYRAEEPCRGEDVDAFLRAASAALGRVLAELRRDVEQAIGR